MIQSPLSNRFRLVGRNDGNRKELINLFTYKPIYFQKNAFTLAEVLVTLGIIGVVAAMTIPTLMSKIANVRLESQFKKGHSLLAQAVKMYNSDEERAFGGVAEKNFEVPDLRKYFTGTTSCNNKDAGTSKYCIARTESSGGTTTVTNKDYKYTNYSRTAEYVTTNSFDDNQFFLNNGMLIIVDGNPWNGNHILVTIDTNGKPAKPNSLGHDVFMFELAYSDKEGGFEILPSGAPGTYYKDKGQYCSETNKGSTNGLGCAYYALSDSGYFKNLP